MSSVRLISNRERRKRLDRIFVAALGMDRLAG
jgi:hypothetical protein